MGIDVKEDIVFEKREILNGKQEKYVKFRCDNCNNHKGLFYKNKKCIKCLLRNLNKYINYDFDYIIIGLDKIILHYEKIEVFLNYLKRLEKLKNLVEKFSSIRNDECKYKDFKCKYFENLFSKLNPNELEYYEPIDLILTIKKARDDLKEFPQIIKDKICRACFSKLKKLIQKLYEFLLSLQLYKILNENMKFSSNFSEIYSSCFGLLYLENKKKLTSLLKNKRLLKNYKIGREKIFEISIYSLENDPERLYKFNLKEESEGEENYIIQLSDNVQKKIDRINPSKIIPIEELIKYYEKESFKVIKNEYKLASNSLVKRISFFTALKILNFEKIFPLLIDDYIEEIFLDKPWERIYINHQLFGRCLTEITLNKIERNRIKTFMRLYSNKRLDYSNPSIKFVLKNNYFYCRFTVDIDPINIHKFSFDIRKLNKNILTIQDLMKNNTLNPRIAAFLYFLILRRKNFTVTGETDTGKTTLINAFDLITPKQYRKIYIENATESLNQDKFEKHQLKFKVDSIEDTKDKRFSKTNQIKKLLHRSPDVIYLGEILTKQEAEAMFHCLSAGLKGFQTIHSNDLDSLINRFLFHFNINKSCLNDLDIVIFMKKSFDQRRIISVSEINKNHQKNNPIYNKIFQYNPKKNDWDNLNDLYETQIINNLKEYEKLDKEFFFQYFHIYEEIFTFLLDVNKIRVEKLVDFFHKLSYHSRISIDKLKDFWIMSKKSLT